MSEASRSSSPCTPPADRQDEPEQAAVAEAVRLHAQLGQVGVGGADQRPDARQDDGGRVQHPQDRHKDELKGV